MAVLGFCRNGKIRFKAKSAFAAHVGVSFSRAHAETNEFDEFSSHKLNILLCICERTTSLKYDL
jgi:hypothetical protein